jgi:hypothetical protein
MSDKKQSGKPENKSDQRYKPWLRKSGTEEEVKVESR